MAIKAYRYIRYSTSEQRAGDSQRRQEDSAQRYAEKNGLILDDTLTMTDLGVSAYGGKNAESGALKNFLDAVDNGTVSRGSYLLVESLDRLSRMPVFSAFTLLNQLIGKGIVVVTLSPEMKYDESAALPELMMSLMTMSRAHEESAIKSKRVREAWAAKRKNASTTVVTKWVPAWLRLDDDGKIVEITDRVELIQNLYAWTIAGNGMRLIMKKIEALKIKPWGASTGINLKKIDEERNRCPKKWHISYINRLLTNRAVLGEYQPRADQNGSDNVIKNYFPRIIDEETFFRVQVIRKSRKSKLGHGSGPKGKHVSNLFSGLLKCGYSTSSKPMAHRCAGRDSSVSLVNKGQRSATKYLQCTRLKEGNAGCEKCNKLWRLDDFETAFLTHVNDIDVSILLGSVNKLQEKINGLEKEISALRGTRDSNDKQIKKILLSIKSAETIPSSFVEEASRYEAENKSIVARIEEKHVELKAALSEKNTKGKDKAEFKSLLKKLESQKGEELFQIRLQLSHILRQSIASIEVYAKGNVETDEHMEETRKLLKKLYGTKRVKRYEGEMKKNEPLEPLHFFVVNYKTGESRMVMPSRDDPKNLHVTAKWDSRGMIETEFPFPKTQPVIQSKTRKKHK